MITLSKTDYLLYRECPKNTWLKIHRPDIYYKNELSAFEKAIIETGNEVELYAKQLFPNSVLIEGRDEIAQKKTSLLIANLMDTTTIFQPIFKVNNYLAAIDVLRYDPTLKSSEIFEIKASNDIKEKLHAYDLAFQVALLKMANIPCHKANILHLNKEYVRNGDLEIIKLFVTDDITQEIMKLLPEVEDQMERALLYCSKTEEPGGPCTCIYKGRSSHCTTFSYSNPHVPEYSVHDIARIGMSKKKLLELIDSDIYEVDKVPEHIELSQIQQNQVLTAVNGRTIINQDKIREELNGLQFPLYFLDYETFPCAIPRFDGYRPYEQIPFQYSLHILEKDIDRNGGDPNIIIQNDQNLIHREFLHTDSDDPGPHILNALKRDIGPVGTIIVWNKKFESKINQEIGRRIPSGKIFMENINSRMYDLMDIFSKQYYVHKDFMGSTSIKYVLPVLAPELNYKDLEIREGGTASQKWNEVVLGHDVSGHDLNTDEKKEIAENLKKYCGLDTYAMYNVWKKLTI